MSVDLQSRASELLSRFGSEWVPEKVARLLETRNGRIWVAFSGGADSMALLLWAYAYFDERGESSRLCALHFDHALRGEESTRDAEWCAAVCADLGIELRSGRWNRHDLDGSVSEELARSARLAFFEGELSSGKEQDRFVLTGHNRTDVAETMMMRLSRGSGLEGLVAPRPVSTWKNGIAYLRPLLGLDRSTIRERLRSIGAEWREDATNQGRDYLRNRVRLDVLPALEATAERSAVAGFFRSRALLEEDAEALGALAGLAYEAVVKSPEGYALSGLEHWPDAIIRRLLHRLCGDLGEPIRLSARVCDLALEAIRAEKAREFEIGSGVALSVDRSSIRLQIKRENPALAWNSFDYPLGCWAYLPNGSRVMGRIVSLSDGRKLQILNGQVDNSKEVYLNTIAQQNDKLSVRRWEEGDAYVPLGLNSKKKLKNLFSDRKVPLRARRANPLFLGAKGEILWSPGLPPNHSFLIDAESTHALQLAFEA